MSDILSVGSLPIQDNSIKKKQLLTYSPYTTTYGHNDEIRIAIQSQDLYVLPSESYIFLEFRVSRKAGADNAAVVGNWTAMQSLRLFSEIRYELNNTEIDRIKSPGLSAYIKALAATPNKHTERANHLCFYDSRELAVHVYTMMVPLHFLFGFCDDYKKIIMNAKHELILVRSRSNNEVYTAPRDAFDIEVQKVQWRVPIIQLSDHAKYAMLSYLDRKQTITVPYRSWDLYEMPQLPQSTKNIWTVKSTTQIGKPRYVICVLQTNRQTITRQSDHFDPCNVSDVKLILNSECYPYENYKSDFPNSNYQDLYHAFVEFQTSYYKTGDTPFLYAYDTFGARPLFVFDCSRTEESMLGGAVDVKLEINSHENIPANTAAYCLIIYENQFEYSPFSSIVVKNT